MKGFYKVPGRNVFCGTLRGWLASCVLSYVVYKLDPPQFPEIPQ